MSIDENTVLSIEEDYSTDYFIYWSALIVYIVTIWGSMEVAMKEELVPLPFSDVLNWSNANYDLRKELHFGL